ncbi:uncharacterized n-acetyltransferase p20 [Phtheirospermum japonicum]|uniref:Uncharacterized n-acetyltransferase p20 n=1 Tax=Phtheirospermum japonicum TaxID=374723 RepID=A0A830B2E3_9LAMI|nr:uncharacterized n-acetyltransferase p20 [Phtheirospermum japonicum]
MPEQTRQNYNEDPTRLPRPTSSHCSASCIDEDFSGRRQSICIDGRSIGFVSVFPGSGDDRCRADIGYAVAVEHWGQGIATRAVKLAVPMVFRDFSEVLRVQGFANVENKGSQRVMENAGFRKEGLLRNYCYLKGDLQDLVLYSFLSTDF